MRTDFARGSSRPAPFQNPTEFQPWAPRHHLTCIELRTFIFRIHSEQSLQHHFGTQPEPLLIDQPCIIVARTTHVHVCMHGGERGGTKGQKGEATVPLHAHDPLGPHIHPQ